MREPISLHSAEVLASCERLMRTGSHSFFAASRILPQRFKHAATAVYAFCRVADDAVDEMPPGASIEIVMDYLRERLEAIYRGEPFLIDADIAFAAIVREYAIPKAIPMALLEGFQWDASGRDYETLEALYDYAARVAGTVGAMMTLVMGGRSAQTIARACELGVAMQLTNIARDVGEDVRRGRIYLPLRWLREAGIDPQEFLRRPQYSESLAGVIARLLQVADQLYVRAETGIASLPRDCRPAIMSARLIYADIGRVIRGIDCDVVHRRAVVGTSRKWWLMARALVSLLLAPPKDYLLQPLASVRFLVASAPVGERDAVQPDLLISTIGLLERLGHRSRSRRGQA
jgi:15-cis-phytoene synthase